MAKEMQEKIKVEYISIDKLKEYENNAKEHPQEQVEQIKTSIDDFGMIDPIGVWGDDNTIVEGHGRLLACKELGITEVPIIRLDHLTDKQRRKYGIVHNKTTMNSGFDDIKLDLELEDLDFSEYEFDFGEVYDEGFGTDFSLPDGDKSVICQMTFTLHEKQKELIEYAISAVKDNIAETFGNSNSNGNALYEVVRQWAEQRK